MIILNQIETIQILGDELEDFFEEKGYGILKYKGNDFEVWELSKTEYNELYKISDEEWENDWGQWRWWCYGESTFEGSPLYRFRVNGEIMFGYINRDRLTYLEELEEDESYFTNSEYKDFREWAYEVMGYNTKTDITCLAISLAKENEITLARFMEIYQP